MDIFLDNQNCINRLLDEYEQHKSLIVAFDVINKNSPNIDFAYGKLYYNVLLDDRAGLESAYNQLREVVKIINERGNV